MNSSVKNIVRRKPSSSFTFGKHKGESVMDVIDSDPGFVIWCLLNTNMSLSPFQAKYLGEKYGKTVPSQYVMEDPSLKLSRSLREKEENSWKGIMEIPYETLLERFENENSI